MPPLVPVAAAWALGLVLAHHLLVPVGVRPGALFILATVPLAAASLYWRDRSLRLGAVCVLAMLGGALRYHAALPHWDDPAFAGHYNGSGRVTLQGVVRAYPDVRDTWTNLRLDAESIEVDGQIRAVHGTILVRAPRWPGYAYGDRLRVTGELESPPVLVDFDYRTYLARQGVNSYVDRPRLEVLARGQGSRLQAALFAAKDRAAAAIARLLPEPEAALLQGILLGIRGGIPRPLYDQFNATGTSHVIVISGSNIALVASLLSRLFGRLIGQRRAYWLTVGGIALYVLFVGADAAVARAGLMGGLLVTAQYLGRRATAYVSLCAAGLLLTVISPLALWDPGFQLSFAATLSLILFTPPLERACQSLLERRWDRERARQMVAVAGDVLIVTLAAQVLTLPLVLYHFGRLSLVAPLANLLILPAQGAIMGGGALAAAVALVPGLSPLAQVLFWLPWLALAYTVAVVRWLSGWPWASLAVSPERAGRLVLYYGLLLAALWAVRRGHVRRLDGWLAARWGRRATILMLAPPLVLLLLTGIAIGQQPDGRLHVAFLDVGEGDAVLITTPVGQQVLVDGGPSPTALAAGLGRHMPFWDRTIDLAVMTHADTDHLAGLTGVLPRYRLGGWLESAGPHQGELYRSAGALLDGSAVPRHVVDAGDQLDLGQGVTLQVLSPPSGTPAGQDQDASNNQSVVLRLVWGEAALLLAADAGTEAEGRLLASGQPLGGQVLKVAHHGSDGSSGQGFLAAVAPRYAVISVGADNRFGHPAPGTLERLAAAGAAVLRTDQVGTIEFVTDGRQWWVETEK